MLRSFTVARFSRLLFATALFVGFAAEVAIAQAPSTQASNIIVAPNGISWTPGNGTNKLVVIYSGGGTFTPVNGTDYTADVNTDYTFAGNDKDPGAGVAKIVQNDGDDVVIVTNLAPSAFYTIRVFEFNSTGFLYNTSPGESNPIVVWFAVGAASYTVPAGVTRATVEAWGAGGGGGWDTGAENGAAGGGGGAYARSLLTVVPAAVHAVTVGTGGTGGVSDATPGSAGGNTIFGASLVVAQGGGAVTTGATGAAGGSDAVSTGTVKFSGGSGGNGDTGSADDQGGGGGGGSVATRSGIGVPGNPQVGGSGGNGGDGVYGDGGNGGDDANEAGATAATAGVFPGGGGGGRGDGLGASGAGAGGLVIVTYDATPPQVISIVRQSPLTVSTNAASVTFRVTFNENVSNVTTGDFALTGTASAGATVNTVNVIVANTVFDVVITGVNGNGTLNLDFGANDIVDISNNAFAGTVNTEETYTIDTTVPVISATAPASSALVNNNNVSYTLSEAVASGSITWTRTGGAADGGSPHVQALTGTELNTGAHSNITLTNNPTLVSGAIYSIAFNATDAAGNAATTVTNTNITLDNTAPVFSATAPASSTSVNNTQVSYTLSEAITSGSITWTRTGGAADGGSPHVQALTGTELNSGAHTNITLTNNPTLVDGAIYSIAFNGTDAASNAATTVTNTNVTFDTTVPVISATAPASSSLVNNAIVSYTLSEAFSSGTITWTQTGGAADGGSPHVQALTGAELNSGVHSNITLTNNPTLVSGAVYSISFNGNDLAGNPATTVTNTNITFDNTAAVFSATAPASSTFVNNTNVSYTLSEAITSGSITWTRTSGTADPGSPRVQALTGTELASGAHTNITLTNNPALVNGTVYSVAFNGTDMAGNAATTVTNTLVTYDVSAPAAFTVGAVTTVGGTVRANYWNATNASVNIVVPIANDASLMNGFVQLQMKNGSTSFTDLGSTSAISAINGNKTINITAAVLVAHASYGETEVLSFTAVITDAAGNPTTGTQSVTSLTVDTTPPTIIDTEFKADNTNGNPHFHHFACSGTLTTQDSNTEFIHLEMSEDLELQSPDGTLVTLGTPGFTVSAGAFDATCDTRGASVYHVASKTIHLKSNANNNWNGTTTISFTAGGSNIRDLAGNEMGSFVNLLPSDTQAPALATGLVFNPNGVGAEIITFQLSETLNGSVGTTVTGFTTNVGTIATANYNSGTNTVTLTSTSNGMWTDAVLLSYSQAAGNVIDPATNELAAFTNLPIRLVNVNIFSNNANTPASRAKAGNTITLGFTTNAVLSATPTVTIGGQSASVTGGPVNYSATITASAALTQGVPLAIAINALTAADVTDVTVTTNGTQMIYDQTSPTITPVTISSNNANSSSLAKPGNTVTLLFSVNETLFGTPAVTIGGRTATVSGGPLNYSATLLLNGTEPSGVLAFNISIEDLADNAASATATTNASSVTFDKIVPTVSSITLPDANPNNTGTVDFDVLFSEAVTNVDATDFTTYGTASGGGETISNVSGSGTSYTVTVSGISLTGLLGLTLVDDNTIEDVADNDLGGTALNDGNFSSATQYDIILPEPQNHATSFVVSGTPTTTSISLTWVDAIGTPAPSGYLITAERSGATAITPADFGTPVVNQPDLVSNTTGYLNITAGTQAATFSSLLSGETYTFRIYPYTNSGSNIDFKIDGVIPSVSAATTVAANANIGFWTTLTGNISSTGTPTAVLQFYVCDYCSGLGDNAATKISSIVFQRNTGIDQTVNWTNLIASAELSEDAVNSDPSSTISGIPRNATGGDITANTITFSNLLSDAFGVVNNNTRKVYYLRLTLQTPMASSLREIIDGLNIRLLLNRTNISLGSGSTTFNGPNQILNSQSFPVAVVATQLDFSTSPDPSQLVLTDVTSTSASPDLSTTPVIKARDAFGNTDLNFGGVGAITVSSPVAFLPSSALNMTSGKAVMPVFQYQDKGDGTLTASTTVPNANSVVPGPGNSSAVTVNYSQLTTLTTGGGGSTTILPLSTANCCIPVYKFTITDDGAGVGDGSPTRISKIRLSKVASANPIPNWDDFLGTANGGTLLYDQSTGSWMATTRTIYADSIVISNMLSTGTASDLGYIAEGTSRSFVLYIYPDANMGGGLPATVDHMNFDVEVNPVHVKFASQSSAFLPAQTPVNSGPIDIDVAATQLVFTTQPPSDLLVNANLTISPVLQARDNNGNLDLDFSNAVVITNAGGLGMINTPTNFTSGVLTFPAGFQYTQIGANNGDLTVSSAGVTSATSTDVTVRVAKSTTITAGGDAEPATISSLTTIAPGIQVFDFTLNDDAGSENDGSPTQLNDLSIFSDAGDEIAGPHNWINAIAGATLTDGTNTVSVTTINSNSLFFNLSSVPGQALGLIADNASKPLKLNIWLRSNLGGSLPISIDGLNFQFQIREIDITTDLNGSSIINGEIENSGIANEVTVIATRLDFSKLNGSDNFISPYSPLNFPSGGSINTPFTPRLGVEAHDINSNLDVDFTGTITAFTIANSLTTINDPSGSFVAGQLKFPTAFQYTSGNNQDGQITITAGGITTSSPSIIISSSFESLLVVNPTFVPQLKLPYLYHQATNITGVTNPLTPASSSFVITEFRLSDGDAITPDSDGASTSIEDLTLSITHPENIRKIALYIGGTEIQEKAYADFVKPVAADTTVTFSGLSSNVFAADNGSVIISVHVSFTNVVQDNEKIQLRVTSAAQNGGSKFNNIVSNPIGGVTNGAATDGNVRIEVLATQLDFTTQPGIFAGINEPISAPEVRARDANQVVDLDQDQSGTATSPGNIISGGAGISSSSLPFTAGVMSFPDPTFRYTTPGNGTLTVSTTNDQAAPIQGISSTVNVIHVTADLATNGVFTNSLAGGSEKKVIFGVTLRAPYTVTGEPKLNKFIITFVTGGSIIGVFNNIKVFESVNNAFESSVDTDVTTAGIGGKLQIASKSLTIDFTQAGGRPRDLHAAAGHQYTYFLMVDVDPSASGSTPLIQPRLEDFGFGQPNNANIVTSKGSATSSLIGNNFNFAAVLAPTIVSSYPARGQLNIDPTQPTIDLVYTVPVWTLDGKIQLYDYETDQLVTNLTALNGNFLQRTGPTGGTVATPLQFAIPPGTLLPNHMYYVVIPPGKFNGNTAIDNVGIMDESDNESPGFSYSNMLYFKTSNPDPPVLLTSPDPAAVSNISLTGASISGIFNQHGKAYFMVVPGGSAAPSNAQIKGSLYPGTPVRGDFPINQINSIAQYGLINASLTAGNNYDVWMYAESYSSKRVGLVETLTPITTSGPYGNLSSGFAINHGTPTLSFTASGSTSVTIFAPIIDICSDSYQTVNDPIIIVEGDNNDFNTSGVLRTFNLLLPSGFQFDDSKTGSIPNHGTVTISGPDFAGETASLSYINNSILRITFSNDGTSGLDNITITGLRIRGAASSSSDKIVRLGGDALTTLPDNTIFAYISVTDAETIEFTNSYSETEYQGRTPPITVIPDNWDDPNLSTPLAIRLIPQHPAGDYGSSIFNGTGINVNLLNLSAATLDAPFNVTVVHTDNNGCISQTPVQYTVYDHEKAIGGLNTEYCIVNTEFPGAALIDTDSTRAILINYLNNPSSYMLSLRVGVPSSASASQIIQDSPEWGAILKKSMVDSAAFIDASTVPISTYYSYKFDYARILNAGDSVGIPNPYSHFLRTTGTIQNSVFYAGGSLGQVEFTAEYRGRVNTQLEFPLKQNVEFFVPAIPVVEVDQINMSYLDVLDIYNPVPPTPATPPALPDPIYNNKGTPIFCQAGGNITILGFPRAEGTASGKFVLVDATNITDTLFSAASGITPAGFVDNGNGTASLDPTQITNGFRSIKVIYTYKDNNSPCESYGTQVIRITPNPAADYNFSSYTCAGTDITFTEISSIADPANFTIDSLQWDFDDNNSTLNSSGLSQPTHEFSIPGSYNVSLTAISQFNCKSPIVEKAVTVGAVPNVKFNFTGVSTAEPIQFQSQSTVAAPNPTIASQVWNFGQGAPGTGASPAHQYTTAGIYTVELIVTSVIGCRDTLSRNVVVVPKHIPTDTAPFEEKFNSSGGWQVLADSAWRAQNNLAASWKWGVVNGTVISDTTRAWTTSSINGNPPAPYKTRERSALYSPVFDISNLARPMISFNSFVQLHQADGVVLQYSTDNFNIADSRKQWETLGSIEQGVESGVFWYNGEGLASQPGDQTINIYGWTLTPNGDDDPEFEWLESKHTLGDILGNTTKVVFRLALASANGNPSMDGFAIDNVRIGNRTRIVLLENFRNLGNTESIGGVPIEKLESDELKAFNPSGTATSIVKINYHVAFPKMDPLNLDNKQDPGARALYYNVSKTPRVMMDGSIPADALFSTWGENEYNIRSLKLADAEIDAIATRNGEGAIEISVSVKAFKQLSSETIVNIAIVEKDIDLANLSDEMGILVRTNETQFEYVLKKLLPSASGTPFGTILMKDSTRVFGPIPWIDQVSLYDPLVNDLALVVFLQDEDSREIYQTHIEDLILAPPVITGIEDRNTSFNIYPVPADNELVIELPEPAQRTTSLQMFDQLGKVVEQLNFEAGQSRKSVDTSGFAAGVYLLQIDSPKGILRRKVMVVHRN